MVRGTLTQRELCPLSSRTMLCLASSQCMKLCHMLHASGKPSTCKSSLFFDLKYKTSLPRGTPNIKAYVDDTLRSLGLQDVANNRIGTPLQRGISGGQKRRVTIACSVVARPRVLVLDEPTSGLDSGSAREVMASRELIILCIFCALVEWLSSAVKRLSQQTSMICIATIHQPNWELFSLFDQLTLLAGGRVMYNGAAGESRLLEIRCIPF